MNSEHTSKQFDQELEALRARVLQMGGFVEQQVSLAVDALTTGDLELCTTIVANDHKVNGMEVGIDEDCSTIIARRQPAASDLRLIMTVVKTITDLERIGDEAAKIARMARDNASEPLQHPVRLLALNHLSEVCVGMLRRALDAFARLDAAAAAKVAAEDRIIDEEFHAILRQLITFVMEDPRSITSVLQIVWVAKAFERIGDHAKNIAEYVIYIVKGRDVRHIPLAELEREALGR